MLKTTASLVICTRNRAAQLGECLKGIGLLGPTCASELIVDNGSTDATRGILSDFAVAAAFPVTIQYEAKPGLGRARNTGWRDAKGEIIAFTDDDCYVAADYIDRVREIFEDQRIGFAGGRVELFDPTDAPLTIRTETEPERLPPRSFFEPGWILGANMMIRRDVLVAIGGFDPDLGAGLPLVGEDTDALARASRAGWWGAYEPAAVVDHHHRRKAADHSATHRPRRMQIGTSSGPCGPCGPSSAAVAPARPRCSTCCRNRIGSAIRSGSGRSAPSDTRRRGWPIDAARAIPRRLRRRGRLHAVPCADRGRALP